MTGAGTLQPFLLQGLNSSFRQKPTLATLAEDAGTSLEFTQLNLPRTCALVALGLLLIGLSARLDAV